MATEFRENAHVAMMLLGYPEKLVNLYNINPSFNRIFMHYELDRLMDNEILEFFLDTFKKVNMECEKDSLDKMISFSTGLPMVMQEIGDSVFWEDQDNIINDEDANRGIFEAGLRIGKKFIEPVIDTSIVSPRYKSILQKMGKHTIINFKKKILKIYI